MAAVTLKRSILEPLLSDIQQLSSQDGYTFTLDNGRCLTLQGALAAYIADTPASHEAAGLKEGVGLAFKKCRHCHATFDLLQNCYVEEEFDLRNLDEHVHYLDEMEETGMSSHLSMMYGINRASILLQFPHFDICEQMPQDIMHVLLEGVIPRVTKLILHNFITERKLFSLDELNNNLNGYTYAYFNKKYQPSPISADDVKINGDYTFREDADQMWMFSSILPFLVDDFVDEGDEHWHLYQLLMDITRIAFTALVTLETIARLKELISQFLSAFKTLFLDENITPKMHYLVHFPRMLLSIGPLINFWCMRMESKHSYFKSLKSVTGFKNVPLSLAKRYQKLAAIQRLDHCQPPNRVGKCKRLTVEEQSRTVDRLRNQFEIDIQQIDSIHYCSWAEIDNTKYVSNECVVLTGYDANNNPQFCKLESIIYVYVPEHIFFQCQELETLCFNEKLCSYQVEVPLMASGLILYTKDHLKLHEPLQLIRYKDNTFVNCRYHLDDMIA